VAHSMQIYWVKKKKKLKMDKKAKFPFFLEMNWAMCCGPFPSFILVKGDFSPTPS